MIGARSRTRATSCHFTLVLGVVAKDLKIVTNAPPIVVHLDRLEAVAGEKWLLGLIKLSLDRVGARTHTLLSLSLWLNQGARADRARPIPVDCVSGRPFDLVFDQLVRAGTDAAWIINQATHLANFIIVVSGARIDDRGEEAGRDARH